MACSHASPGGDEKIVDRLEGRAAVKIVGVDDGEGAVDEIARAEHRVPRAPRLLPPLGNRKSTGSASSV